MWTFYILCLALVKGNNVDSVRLKSAVQPGINLSIEYYWQEYTGEIPYDALPGGKDLYGYDTYIGQAYFHGQGVYPVQIFRGKKEVEIALYGVKRVDKDIKILCVEDINNFEWISTTNKNFHLNTTNRHPIVGGYDFPNKGMLHIGSLMYQGIEKVGKIGSYRLEDAIFHFTHGNMEMKATMYQVLLCSKSESPLLDERTDLSLE